MPWWVIVLIALGALVAGGVVGGAAMLLYIGKGMWQ